MLIDSHCHLFDEKYNDTKAILNNALDFGVSKMISIGTSLEDSLDTALKIRLYQEVSGTIGVYPQENTSYSIDEIIKKLEEIYSRSSKIVAIGEIGIDIVEDMKRPLEQQKQLFTAQINLAKKLNLPIVIHNRNGTKEVLEVLKNNNHYGVLHCFVEDWEVAKKFLDLGFLISFSGIITYKSGVGIHETVKNIPSDRYLIETDSPYLSPQGYRKETNEPKYVRIVAEKVAEIRNSSLQVVSEESTKNATALFKLD